MRQRLEVEELSLFDISFLPDLYRPPAQPDEDMVTSVCTKGILEPIIVAELDKFVVIDGKLRIMAAMKCQERGIKIKVPVLKVNIDLSTPQGRLEALMLRFTANYNIFGRDKEEMQIKANEAIPILKELIVTIAREDQIFATQMARGVIDESFARRVAHMFGVSTSTARRWIQRTLSDSEVNKVLSEVVKESIDHRAEEYKPVETIIQRTISKATHEVDKHLPQIPKVERSQRVERPHQAEEYKPKPLEQSVMCGSNTIPQQVFDYLISDAYLAPLIRDMCKTGILTREVAVEIKQIMELDGPNAALKYVAVHYNLSDTIRLFGPKVLPEILRIIADKEKVPFNIASNALSSILLIIATWAIVNNKVADLLQLAKQAHIYYYSNRIDEAVGEFIKLFSK